MTTTSLLTETEQRRLAEIRSAAAKFEAQGADVSSWESTFMLALIERLLQRIRVIEK